MKHNLINKCIKNKGSSILYALMTTKDFEYKQANILKNKYECNVIFNNEESYAASDCTQKELFDFLDSLTNQQFKQIEKFFDTMPVLSHTVVVKNPKTEVENTVVLTGLTSFFI